MEVRIAAEQNVGSAAGHVGRDRDRAFAPGLRDDEGFTLVILGVEDFVRDTHALQDARQLFRLLDRYGADQHRLAPLVQLLDVLGGVAPLLVLGPVDDVGELFPLHRPVGGNRDHFELVDLLELGGFGLRGARHAGELLVHAEVVLEGDGGERLVLALDLDAFLGFDRLVQAIGPAAAGHDAARELVDDDHLPFLNQVVLVAHEEDVRAQGLLDVVPPGQAVHVHGHRLVQAGLCRAGVPPSTGPLR